MLNVYAFCNTHDVTWGTKGDDKAEKLPSANVKPGGKVDVSIPQDGGDLNAQYDIELALFATKPEKEVRVVSEAEKQEDYYKGFRSGVVLVWIFCNFALGAVVLSTAGLEDFSSDSSSSDDKRSDIYMSVILWSVAGLSFIKFIGAMWFLVVRMVSQLSFWGKSHKTNKHHSSAAFERRCDLRVPKNASIHLYDIPCLFQHVYLMLGFLRQVLLVLRCILFRIPFSVVHDESEATWV